MRAQTAIEHEDRALTPIGWILSAAVGISIPAGCNGCEAYGEDADTTGVYTSTETADDEAGGTSGDPPPEPGACAPFDTSEEIGDHYACEGWGVGAASFQISGTNNAPFGCASSPDHTNIEDCVANPIAFGDIAMQTEGSLANPDACCTPLEPEVLEITTQAACLNDCAHASCQWSVLEMRELAETLSCANPAGAQCLFRNDLIATADQLETTGYEDCIKAIKEHPGEVILHDLGSQGGNAVGNIENVRLYLQCNVTAAVLDEPVQACTEPANAIPIPGTQPLPGIDQVAANAITFASGMRAGTAEILDVQTLAKVGSDCVRDVCPFELVQYDVLVEDIEIGIVGLENVELHVDEPILGTIRGRDVEFPAGALLLTASANVRLRGDDVLGEAPSEIVVSNAEMVRGTYVDGRLALHAAGFDQGSVIAVLDTRAP